MSAAEFDARVLLIEDEILVAGMLKSMLTSLGYAVAGTTADLREAAAVLDREKVDAVVLDINLNGEMSYSFADKLVARGIPFIFSTGYERQGLPVSHADRPLLKKPFRRSALGNALADLLQRAKEPAGPGSEPAAADSESDDDLRERRAG